MKGLVHARKIILCAVLFMALLFSKQLQAQQKGKISISGVVIDSITKKSIAYATINLLDTQHNAFTSTYTNESGAFTLYLDKHGSFIVEITSVGYNTKEIPVVVNTSQTTVNIGQLSIAETTSTLQEVTVSAARKRLIEQRPGMLVYNAENDLSNKGGTAADVLRKAPVLNVDAQGNVSMRGSGNLKILINGKYSGQMARSPADALNMMSADIIKSVEVITTPSAKYDAEGAAGVINIITKKGRKDFNGTIEASGSNYAQMINPRLSLGTDKWNFNITGHMHRLRTKEAYGLERIQYDNGQPSLILDQQNESDNVAPHGSADISIVYTPDSVNEFSLGIVSWIGKWPGNNNLSTAVRSPSGTVIEQYMQSTNATSNFLGSDINLAYNRKFKREGQELTLLTQFSPSRDRSDYFFLQQNTSKELLYQETNNSNTNNKEWTFQLDYSQPLSKNGKYSLETGLKMISRNVGNRYNVTASETDPTQLIPQPLRSDYFKYKQDVYAGYAIIKMNLKNNWYVETGLRLEETKINGDFTNNGDGFNNSFTNFIPTATISKKLSDAQTLGLSYSKRLTRPYIWDLNPNADASDPKNIETGNPALNPEIAHQAEITYGINAGENFFLNTALFWKQTDNAIIDFTSTDVNGISTTSKQNLAANKQYGLNFSSFVSLTKKVSLNGNVNISYLDYSSGALQILSKGWAADVDMNMTWKMPKNYSLQLFGEYDGREVTLQGYQSQSFFYSLAAKKSIPAKKINITAAFINPFSAYIPQKDFIKTIVFESTQKNRYYSREFKLTVNWEFGSMFHKKESKKVANDDVKDQGKG